MAAILAYAAIKSNDRVGLIIFSDRIEHFIPPKKGRAHVWRVIRDILGFRTPRRGTAIEVAADYLNQVVRRRAVVFLISDFVDRGYERGLRLVAARHDLTAVTLVDRRELEIPPLGLIELEDAETGERLMVDTAAGRNREALRSRASQIRAERARFFRSAGIGEVEIRADDPHFIESLIGYFHLKEQRR